MTGTADWALWGVATAVVELGVLGVVVTCTCSRTHQPVITQHVPWHGQCADHQPWELYCWGLWSPVHAAEPISLSQHSMCMECSVCCSSAMGVVELWSWGCWGLWLPAHITLNVSHARACTTKGWKVMLGAL